MRKEIKNLKEKLRSAVERIKSLGIERQKLNDVGNRLRAQIQQGEMFTNYFLRVPLQVTQVGR